MPMPQIPLFTKMANIDILIRLLSDSFGIAILTFVLNISFAKLFAKKHMYEISPNQVNLYVIKLKLNLFLKF